MQANRTTWQLGYRCIHVEKLAVNAAYSHDDVSRLGAGPQTANSDPAGHDLYANYALTMLVPVGLRTMLVHRLSNAETLKRFRLDFSYSF